MIRRLAHAVAERRVRRHRRPRSLRVALRGVGAQTAGYVAMLLRSRDLDASPRAATSCCGASSELRIPGARGGRTQRCTSGRWRHDDDERDTLDLDARITHRRAALRSAQRRRAGRSRLRRLVESALRARRGALRRPARRSRRSRARGGSHRRVLRRRRDGARRAPGRSRGHRSFSGASGPRCERFPRARRAAPPPSRSAVGAPRAVRAVGAANGANPVAIAVPCHRVIASDGTLHGYGGGLERKRWLLAHESAARSKSADSNTIPSQGMRQTPMALQPMKGGDGQSALVEQSLVQKVPLTA